MPGLDSQLADDELKACPNCDSSAVHTNGVGGYASHNPDAKRYRCSSCYELFDEAVVRTRHEGGGGGIRGDTLAGDLADADPEEVFGSDD